MEETVKEGNRSLCMAMEEVKACRDLGFELEHNHKLQQQEMMMPSRLSLSTLDYTTSSGGNSPIANWRISSPGMPCLPFYVLRLNSIARLHPPHSPLFGH